MDFDKLHPEPITEYLNLELDILMELGRLTREFFIFMIIQAILIINAFRITIRCSHFLNHICLLMKDEGYPQYS